jgi:glycosyltransferase involved in cell wall biosynthesis
MEYDSKIHELTIVIPCYNEAKNLRIFLPQLITFCKENYYKLIIINDGSVDESEEILFEYINHEHFKIIKHKINKGYGAAIKSGIIEVQTKFLITIDGDGQHNLEDIKKLHQIIKEKDADMIVGSRINSKPHSLYRQFGKFLIRIVAKILMPLNIYDINSGMKIYKTELAKKYIKLCPDTMAFSDIITLAFINQKYLVLETPININRRIQGESSISAITAFETTLALFNILMLFNPLRVFLPTSIILLILGLLWGIPIIIMGRGLSVGALLAVLSSIAFFLLGLIAEQLASFRKQLLSEK